MSEGRCCCNCRHDIRQHIISDLFGDTGEVRCHCDIDGHSINYVQTFEGWCRHWAKDHTFDEEEAKRGKK